MSLEQRNSVINKFLGGKRINFTQKNSYSTRVQAAVVSYNSGEYLRFLNKYVTHKNPGTYFINLQSNKFLWHKFIFDTNMHLYVICLS